MRAGSVGCVCQISHTTISKLDAGLASELENLSLLIRKGLILEFGQLLMTRTPPMPV